VSVPQGVKTPLHEVFLFPQVRKLNCKQLHAMMNSLQDIAQ